MRRELTIRCVAAGSIETESPDGTRSVLRELCLELDGASTRVRIMETWERGEHTRDATVEFGRIAVRTRTGHELDPPSLAARRPLDWLIAIADSMVEGDCRTVSLWVRSTDLAALVHATPVGASGPGASARAAGAGEGTAETPPMPHLRLAPAVA